MPAQFARAEDAIELAVEFRDDGLWRLRGAATPQNGPPSQPGTPASAMVGMSGNAFRRARDVTASPRTLPALMNAPLVCGLEKCTDTSPPISAVTAWPPPFNGMWMRKSSSAT